MQFPFRIAADKEFDVAGFGENAIDYLMVAPNFPAFDTKVRFIEHAQAAGGQIASAMAALQRLDLRTADAGRFGADAEGRFGLQSLAEEGVDTRFTEVIEEARTQTAFVIIAEQSGERTVLSNSDERLIYSADKAPLELARRARVLHLDANSPQASVVMARAAKASGAIVSAILNHIYQGLEECLPLVDILITDEDFPLELTGTTDVRASLTEIKSRYNCAIAGVITDSRGATLLCENRFIEAPAFQALGGGNTIGSGDAFHAGFLYGLVQGEEVEASLRFGCAAAALKSRALGARRASDAR